MIDDYSPIHAITKPLKWRMLFRLHPVVHEFWCNLMWIGMRDRLRCPECRAVGTWKPHGGWWDIHRSHDRPVRRWLCKYCGHYEGPEGQVACFPDPDRHVWSMPYPLDPLAKIGTATIITNYTDYYTPMDRVNGQPGAQVKINPWGG